MVEQPQSLWRSSAEPPPETAELESNKGAKVVVVGGGYTGSSAALHLAEAGIDTILLEARQIGWGGSGRNVGLVNPGLFLNPDDIVTAIGDDRGPATARALGDAPTLVRSLIRKYSIECDATFKGVVKAAHNESALRKVEEHVRQWKNFGASLELLTAKEVRDRTGALHYRGGMIDHRSFTLHPLSYNRGLARAAQSAGARLYENSPASSVRQAGSGWVVESPRGVVSADNVVICLGAYSSDTFPDVAASFVPAGCFILATEPVPEPWRSTVLIDGASFYDTRTAMLFARYDRDYRLIVGSLGWLPSRRPNDWARRAIGKLFPHIPALRVEFAWDGTIDLTDNHLPWLAEPQAGLHFVGGYNGRGIGQGTFWGKALAMRIISGALDSIPSPLAKPPKAKFRSVRRLGYQTAFGVLRSRLFSRSTIW